MLTLTPAARAVTAFSLSVLLIMGYLTRLGVGLVAVVSSDLSTKTSSILISLITVVVGAAVFVLAHLAATTAPEGWTSTAGEAARVLSLVGLAISVLTLLASLAHSDPSRIFPFLL